MEAFYEDMFFEKNPVVEEVNVVEAINKKFNDELELFEQGKLPDNHIFNLGMPGEILQDTCFPKNNIELKASILRFKSTVKKHPFDTHNIKDIASALNTPLAVFSYENNPEKTQNVIIDLQENNKNFLVGIEFYYEHNTLEVSNIRTLFPRENAQWLNWINQNKHLYLNMEKLRVLIDQQRSNLADVEYLNLEPIDRLLQENKNVKHYFANLTQRKLHGDSLDFILLKAASKSSDTQYHGVL
ncbi:MAG: hypothetical protein Ta2B_01720 [Termitinemataceae bacterium]|nr:MAG: hypothetical protein Ta2B_01720 [Termitinemataceae bacterium]